MAKRLDLRALVMSLFALVAIVAIMMQLKNSMPQPPAVLQKMPPDHKVAVLDSSYIDLQLKVIWTMPNAFWHLDMIEKGQATTLFDSTEIHWAAKAVRTIPNDSLVMSTLGYLPAPDKKTAADVAIDLLAAMLKKLEMDGQRVTILQPVTGPAHQTLKGAYFVIAFQKGACRKVRIAVTMPRNENMLVLIAEACSRDYDAMREELQLLVQRLYPIPSSFLR